jgi:tetratricopeptide (TPR) repeat protein
VSGLADPRLVKVRAGSRGSGWAVGPSGVLTARHVVEPFLTGRAPDGTKVDWCVAVPDPAPGTPGFDCAVVWQNPALDLALLQVAAGHREQWARAMAGTPGPVLAEPGTGAVPAEVVGYPDLAVDGAQAAPELALGSLQPARGAVGGRMVFDVAASVPEDSAMWQGMSGAAVRDAHGRLLGVVVQVDKQHQQRRLYVVPLPDPALDAAFGRALTQVGAPAVLEASDAPALRGLLALLDAAGRPYPVAALPELGDLGVRRSRTDVDTRGDPYYPYVHRDIDKELRAALGRRLDGAERRMLLLTGDAMAGKSRTLAEALVRHPGLGARPLLVPHRDADLRQALECAAARGGVVWLDDVNTYATGLDGAVRALAGTPGVIVAATLRTDQFSRLQDNPDLRLMWDVLSETRLVEQVTLETGWADGEQARLAGTESLIRDAVTRGRPLGEALGAADELRKRLHLGSAPEQAIVFTAADWPRTGYPAPLAESLARQLWLTHLPPSAAADLAEMVDEDSERAFREALSWTCAKVAGASALVRRTKNGLIAEDYIVALRTTENVAIPDAIWYQARDLALSTGQAREQLAVAAQAGFAEKLDLAGQVLEPVVSGGSEFASAASILVGQERQRRGDLAGALAAYRIGAESDDVQRALAATLALAYLLQELGGTEEAKAIYQSFDRTGNELPDSDTELPDQYSQVPALVAAARVNLSAMLAEEGDDDGAEAVLRRAVELGGDMGATASRPLGDLLAFQGDEAGAADAYRRAMTCTDEEVSAPAALSLGRLLERQGDEAGAVSAYRQAMSCAGQQESAPAALRLGWLLSGRGDAAGAMAAYQRVIDSGDPAFAPAAMIGLGSVLVDQGDVQAAWTILKQAATGGSDQAADAMLMLGHIAALQQPPLQQEACHWYGRAADAGNDTAMLALALVAAVRQDMAGARIRLQQAVQAGGPAVSRLAGALDDDPASREAARARLRPPADETAPEAVEQNFLSSDFLGVLAWLDGDHDQARDLWTGSFDAAGDPVACLLLHIGGQPGPAA